ncbi:hypothetical protein C8J57DRAFT_1219759 [Mycena rebaudengoi]|nr:hypothetical protein C8J57DRAFT_1219759 [Mycena rebaudengoi]
MNLPPRALRGNSCDSDTHLRRGRAPAVVRRPKNRRRIKHGGFQGGPFHLSNRMQDTKAQPPKCVVTAGGYSSKIALALRTVSLDAERHAAAGAFTLTGCARASLGEALHRGHQAPIKDTPNTASDKPGDFGDGSGYFLPKRPYVLGDSPPASPLESYGSIPSISRTASPFSDFDLEPRAPPVRGRRGKGKERARAWADKQPAGTNEKGVARATLDELERLSRVGTGRVLCAGCNKVGINFPRCTRCKKMWCSRECRLRSTHECGRK